jgi:hypothetical protein
MSCPGRAPAHREDDLEVCPACGGEADHVPQFYGDGYSACERYDPAQRNQHGGSGTGRHTEEGSYEQNCRYSSGFRASSPARRAIEHR